jgi:hypothetical protein
VLELRPKPDLRQYRNVFLRLPFFPRQNAGQNLTPSFAEAALEVVPCLLMVMVLPQVGENPHSDHDQVLKGRPGPSAKSIARFTPYA